MGTAFPDLAFVHHNDLIGVLNGGQAVRHHNGGSASHQRFQGFLNPLLRLGVDVGGSLV